MNNSSFPEFIIIATNDEKAHSFAQDNNIADGTWFRLPSTLEDHTEAFIKEITPILSKEEWNALSEEEYNEKSLVGSSKNRILFARDLGAAARYASKRNWWLHAWKFVSDSDVQDVVEYGYYC